MGRDTDEIGIAGASYTFDVSGVASLVPNKGAIVVQVASNYFARMEGENPMREGGSVEAILAAMKDDKFNPERQQYGVILLQENTKPLVYSGKEIKPWSGSKQADDFAILGNILTDKSVITQAYIAFELGREQTFANRMMSALKAREEQGGKPAVSLLKNKFDRLYQ